MARILAVIVAPWLVRALVFTLGLTFTYQWLYDFEPDDWRKSSDENDVGDWPDKFKHGCSLELKYILAESIRDGFAVSFFEFYTEGFSA